MTRNVKLSQINRCTGGFILIDSQLVVNSFALSGISQWSNTRLTSDLLTSLKSAHTSGQVQHQRYARQLPVQDTARPVTSQLSAILDFLRPSWIYNGYLISLYSICGNKQSFVPILLLFITKWTIVTPIVIFTIFA